MAVLAVLIPALASGHAKARRGSSTVVVCASSSTPRHAHRRGRRHQRVTRSTCVLPCAPGAWTRTAANAPTCRACIPYGTTGASGFSGWIGAASSTRSTTAKQLWGVTGVTGTTGPSGTVFCTHPPRCLLPATAGGATGSTGISGVYGCSCWEPLGSGATGASGATGSTDCRPCCRPCLYAGAPATGTTGATGSTDCPQPCLYSSAGSSATGATGSTLCPPVICPTGTSPLLKTAMIVCDPRPCVEAQGTAPSGSRAHSSGFVCSWPPCPTPAPSQPNRAMPMIACPARPVNARASA
jgi:hypothetical protein